MAGHFLRDLGRTGLDLLYPPTCPGCREPLSTESAMERGRLCPDCRATLSPCQSPKCEICGEPFPLNPPADFTCGTCRGIRFSFEFAVAAYDCEGLLRDLVHRFKYDRELPLRLPLAHLLSRALEEPRIVGQRDWVLVPVPLHHRRKREREFNQAEELARFLAKSSGLPWVQALKRHRYTLTQTSLRRNERRENLNGAFSIRSRGVGRIQDRSVLLVDDVFTTGSTASECAGVLRDEGVKKVVVITVGRG